MAMTPQSNTIPLGLYLWKRIYEVGVRTVMGVPGDFNLQILDYIYEVDGMRFVGNSNELNASYAADGYARANGTPGCLITTHGVGELSAINGIGGAQSERIPLIHVVGQTSKMFQDKNVMIHHSMGMKPDHQLYNKISKHVRADAAELWNGEDAPAEIDRVIRECVLKAAPVYIFMPLDIHAHQVPANLLDKKIDLSMPVDTACQEAAITAIKEALTQAKSPVIFLDMLIHSYAIKEATKLIDAVKLPFFAAHGAKGIVDEDHPRFVQLYNGSVSHPGVAEAIEGSDQVLAVGWFPADTNGGLFRKISESKRIDVMDTYVTVNGKKYDNVYMAPLLEALIKALADVNLPKVDMPKLSKLELGVTPANDAVNHNYLWPRMGQFFKPGDIVVADTGSSQYGIPDAKFPKDVLFFTQIYWGAIGYGCPAAMGADFARSERPGGRGRTVLITGDGGLMLTIQEIAVAMVEGLKPIILIVNNNGYTIERAIHGARQKYNNIPPFKYSHLLSFFGGESKPGVNYHLVKTRADLESTLTKPNIVEPTEVQIIEVILDVWDIPWKLAGLLKARGGNMAEYLVEEGFSNAKVKY